MRSAVVKEKNKDKNVVFCRLKKTGKRFELALNRDKVPDKKDLKAKGIEDELPWATILSQEVIFANAAKNEPANPAHIDTAFPDLNERQRYLEILVKGEILQSQEEREESVADEKHQLHNVAAHVANMIHARPDPDERLGKKKDGKVKLERFTEEDVARELKNVKFKPLCTTARDQAVEGVVACANGVILPVLREQSSARITPAKGQDLKSFGNSLATKFQGYLKLVKAEGGSALVVLDPTFLNEITEFIGEGSIEVVNVAHIPKSPEEDLTFELPAAAIAAKEAAEAKTSGGKKGKKKEDPKKEEKKGSDKGSSTGAGGGGAFTKSLEDELAALKLGDDDDGKKKGKKGKGGGGGGAKPAPAPKAAPKASGKKKDEFASSSEDSGSEDDGIAMEVPTMKPKKRR